MAIGNSIGEQTTGVVGFTGTAFTASPTTPFLVQIGGASSDLLAQVPIGTATQVLTSNGAGVAPTFQTAGGGGLLTISGQITSAQIKAIHGTPYQILAGQGAGTIIIPINASASFVYGGSNVFVAGSAQTIVLYYGTALSTLLTIPNATIVGTTNMFLYSGVGISSSATSSASNVALNWYNPVVTEISGNAANNNVINWTLTYKVITA